MVAAFGYPDCPGHPAWLPSATHRTHGIRSGWWPTSRTASCIASWNFAAYSRSFKLHGREVCTMHADDAAARGIAVGSVGARV
jgi:biotin/methionine sulfoxide reductase